MSQERNTGISGVGPLNPPQEEPILYATVDLLKVDVQQYGINSNPPSPSPAELTLVKDRFVTALTPHFTGSMAAKIQALSWDLADLWFKTLDPSGGSRAGTAPQQAPLSAATTARHNQVVAYQVLPSEPIHD
jgi:hypothetical protein